MNCFTKNTSDAILLDNNFSPTGLVRIKPAFDGVRVRLVDRACGIRSRRRWSHGALIIVGKQTHAEFVLSSVVK